MVVQDLDVQFRAALPEPDGPGRVEAVAVPGHLTPVERGPLPSVGGVGEVLDEGEDVAVAI